MKQTFFILTIILFVSCGNTSETKKIIEQSSTKFIEQKDNLPADVALKFINSYVDNCNKMNKSIGVIEWVNSNHLTTDRFKFELKTIVDEAYKEDRELGLGFDPIFDAQDYPDKGFELESFDSKTNFVVVKGKNWANFKSTIKLVFENDNWLVDGCGIINIPNEKRIAR